MTTITPSVAAGSTDRQGEDTAAGPSRRKVAAERLRGERTRQWLRRKAVAAW
jgi:hypothetical protein